MLRALTTQLIREGRVTTTKARAKALRDEAERMITPQGRQHAPAARSGYIYDKQLVHALFDKAPDRYSVARWITASLARSPVVVTMPKWPLSNWSEFVGHPDL